MLTLSSCVKHTNYYYFSLKSGRATTELHDLVFKHFKYHIYSTMIIHVYENNYVSAGIIS